MILKKFKNTEEMMKYFGIKNWYKNEQKVTKNVKKSQNPVKKAIDLSKMINNMPSTQNKRNKKYEHKLNNNIRLQITIDCRIL